MSLKGKRVVIIGGTSGIGLSTARAFLDQSAQVIIASRSAAKLSAAKKALGDQVDIFELDFRNEEMVADVFNKIGKFDHLVITAGEITTGRFSDLPISDAKESFENKFWGQYITVRAAVPYLNNASSITMTSGGYAKGATTLEAVNSAVEGLVRGLAVDLAPVRVNVVSPGMVDTPLFSGMPEELRQESFSKAAQHLPVGRVGKPEDIAQSYVYLAENGFTTGTVVTINGGAHLG
ncbi:SDR family oxidoreductase [Peribacillus cavernae]|uniref:SDR family oxidoreductase n=1 Tax=Peribacillus cavernae TaxID=1674310 RepID=A0A3S1B586_9BACI|nr:SDR family oxidoreductase [Peribacillus cavernae]MDQ0220198.1 NAD(P)-dependent dehydrogenase (short-subunit alcohol dehydrogenase family) [Peribacillus cavernae]RUQ28820.1 SDR family oxidoreductase [Peribacillus cavernae]